MLFADLLSLHLVTFSMLFILVDIIIAAALVASVTTQHGSPLKKAKKQGKMP